MGFVVEGLAERLRLEYGKYDWQEEDRFCEDLRLEILRIRLCESLPAMCFGNTIVVDDELEAFERRAMTWLEAARTQVCVGNREFWRSRPQGDITWRKFTRRTIDLAATFPDGSPEWVALFLTLRLA